MVKSTKHFNPYGDRKMLCPCCGAGNFSSHLLVMLELLRVKFGKPVIISSGYRCEKHNKDVGGTDGSKHKLGTAADVYIHGVSPQDIYEYLCDTFPNEYGIACYEHKGFVHVDVRADIWRAHYGRTS